MALQKQTVPINFAKGVDTKTDPKQLPLGKFLALNNSVFTEGEELTKRNGFGALPALPDNTSTLLTTFNDNLSAIGSSIQAYSSGLGRWINKGAIQPAELSVLPLIRSSITQTQADTAIINNLICTVFTNVSSTVSYQYAISDATTGQQFVAPTTIPDSLNDFFAIPRVFALGNYFVIVFTYLVPNTSTYYLKYVAINATTLVASAPTLYAATYVPDTFVAFDGLVFNNRLYLAWNGGEAGDSVYVSYLDTSLSQHGPVKYAGIGASMVSLAVDQTPMTPVIYVSMFYESTTNIYVLAIDPNLGSILTPFTYSPTPSANLMNLTSATTAGSVRLFYEVGHVYSYVSLSTNYVQSITVSHLGAITAGPDIITRGVGLASKAFTINGTIYYALAYQSPFQPTYFVSDSSGNIVAKLAYQNGGGYLQTGLPNVTLSGNTALFPYLFKDLVVPVNKATNPLAPGGIYTQTGVNLASVTIGTSNISTAEIAQDLHLSGGFLWMYDGAQPVEHNFHLYPDSIGILGINTPLSPHGDVSMGSTVITNVTDLGNIQVGMNITGSGIPANTVIIGILPLSSELVISQVATSTHAGTTLTITGNVADGTYYYQVTYEWQDAQGNFFRSAPSVPVSVTTSSQSMVRINIPTLRLTYKISNPVQIVIYRWSTTQQTFFQVNPFAVQTIPGVPPLPNDPSVDSLAYYDFQSDAQIIGNNILYTTGGIVEDIGAPAFTAITLYKSRLFGIAAEDQNLLWYSKTVIEATPVEMSDLFTQFIPPTQAAQGSTGNMRSLGAMDDKLVLFKKNAIYYMTGDGPDNTGANNDFSEPIFITGTVGCENQRSIVNTPNGLIFQSGQGFYLLTRDLRTPYIGAEVEAYNDQTVVSALNVPGTTQIRLTLDSGVVLMYDYFYEQWGTFARIPALSATLYQGLQTYLDSSGGVFQETANEYVDGVNPVLINFTTGWINLAGLQGYERAYFFYLLGTYFSPFKLNVSIAYDYNPSFVQSSIIAPDNYSPAYGGDSVYGAGQAWGGPGSELNWRVFLQVQKCKAFQITVQEIYDSSYGVPPGAGFTLSGIDLVVGIKDGKPRLRASRSVG